MLRYSFLPSDFNPMLLILGDKLDMISLASILDELREEQRNFDMKSITNAARSDTCVWIYCEAKATGLRFAEATSKNLKWILDTTRASDFASAIRSICCSNARSGSVQLTCGSPQEIPVKISFGEFPDDFLIFSDISSRYRANGKGSLACRS